MSPASRSKSKSGSRAAKEQQKSSSKPSAGPANAGSGVPASAYNPISGTFHMLETAPTASSPQPHSNGRFRTIDETDEHSGSSLGTGPEYDSVSNNDSCSVESEDQKEKSPSVTPRPEAIPGSDNDKRDKIRQKNERKHQRQREKRAQELHERCCGYLMSRKLEKLAQTLVSMGFLSERATMALILNEGRVEESIAWLLEVGEEANHQKDTSNLASGRNLKIDITEEFAQISEIEVRYKCTKQEVERAIVACEGDLKKAVESLRAQKPEPAATSPPKLEGMGDPRAINCGKLATVPGAQNHLMRTTPTKAVASVVIPQQRKDERDFNYTKMAAVPVVSSPDNGTRNLEPSRRMQSKPEWVRPQSATVATPVEKRWPNVSTSPSASHSLATPLQASVLPSKTEARCLVSGSEGKVIQTGPLREPVIVMQRPQSVNANKQNPTTSISASSPVTTGWYPTGPSGTEMMKANGGLVQVPAASNRGSQQIYLQRSQHQQPYAASSTDSSAAVGWGSSWSMTGPSSLAVPSSLGLFMGWSSNGTSSGSSSPVDWTTAGSMPVCDYNNIDWSLESTTTSPSSRQDRLSQGLTMYMKSSRMYDGWPGATTGVSAGATRIAVNGMRVAGLREGGVATDVSSPSMGSHEWMSDTSTSAVGSHEWTSPFAGKDLLSLPREFVTSPTL
ncbi:uncharacterized protein LOC131250939 [Magnolia sinica]|uniref:uncharacterized protein LOC131250939 n=1 Tax=Magnolia sinica TaxID=86752 RepID=UPI00265A4478|nr:uncharacterized protein LOC131250939 [Magnolia sinica]XP_058107329.1 uncharacterized protein LOC131250939 [Magnolia sinica]